MVMKCMIVDDEPPATKIIESYIAEVSGLELVAICHNAVEAFHLLQRTPVDLLFLDIKMPRMSGLELLSGLSALTKIIITTAYREYAFDGYEFDVVDYLLKPIPFTRFLKAIAKMNRWTLATQQDYEVNKEAFLYLRVDRRMRKVLTDDILYLESRKDYVKVICRQETFVIKHTLGALENMLSEHHFLRVHRSFIVATLKITSFSAQRLLLGQTYLPIGRLYKGAVIRALGAAEDKPPRPSGHSHDASADRRPGRK